MEMQKEIEILNLEKKITNFFPENDYQILKITDDFYRAYPNPPYIEILKKTQRTYNCLLFQIHNDYFICILYRTEITHNNTFHFKCTVRSRTH